MLCIRCRPRRYTSRHRVKPRRRAGTPAASRIGKCTRSNEAARKSATDLPFEVIPVVPVIPDNVFGVTKALTNDFQHS
jgi:hypothetical protein